MDLFSLLSGDRGVIFNDYPLLQVKKIGDSDFVEVRGLPSFIGVEETTEGMTFGVDNAQVTFNMTDPKIIDLNLSEHDIVVLSLNGITEKFRINVINKDRSNGFLLCFMKKLEEDDQAITNREFYNGI